MEISFYEHYFIEWFPVLCCCSKKQEGEKGNSQRKLAGQLRVKSLTALFVIWWANKSHWNPFEGQILWKCLGYQPKLWNYLSTHTHLETDLIGLSKTQDPQALHITCSVDVRLGSTHTPEFRIHIGLHLLWTQSQPVAGRPYLETSRHSFSQSVTPL